MARRFVLKNASGSSAILTLDGCDVISGEGADALVQSLDDVEAAEEHLQRLLQVRRKAGYQVVAEEEVGSAAIAALRQTASDGALGIAHDAAMGRAVVTFGDEAGPALVAEVVDRLRALKVRWVQLLCDFESPESFGEAVAKAPLPDVTDFVFDTHFQTATRQDRNRLGDLADVLAGLPSLRRGFFTGDLSLRPTTHAALRSLTLIANPLSVPVVEALTASRWPALEELVVDLAAEVRPVAAEALAERLGGMEAPSLRRLMVASLSDVTPFLARILAQRLPARDVALDGVVRDEDALLAVLEERGEVISGLDSLVLPLRGLSTDAEGRARELGATRPAVPREGLLPATYLAW